MTPPRPRADAPLSAESRLTEQGSAKTDRAHIALSYFGKVPSRGDFVRGRRDGALIERLDQWLAQGLECLAVDPQWKQLYDQGGASHFAILGVRRQVALAGHLMPSRDASGRRYPLVVTGSFPLAAAPQAFLARAPIALSRLWTRLERIGVGAVTGSAGEASAALADADRARLGFHPRSPRHDTQFTDFIEREALGSFEASLREVHPGLDLRCVLLALGLLLRPLPDSGASRLERGVRLPLPAEPARAALAAALWTHLVAPFLARGDFEVSLWMPSALHPTRPPWLAIGFAGATPATVQALFDPHQSADTFIELLAPDWALAQAARDASLTTLDSYLQQPGLSLAQATATFTDSFLAD